MTLLQLNIAFAGFTIILISLMAGCLAYSFHAVKTKLHQQEIKDNQEF